MIVLLSLVKAHGLFIYLDDDKLLDVNEWIENAHFQAFIK